MNPEYLKLFVLVSRSKSISEAGKELGLSPALASAHLAKLESSLDARLVNRTTRSTSLTEAGQRFLPHAEDVLASLDAARAAVSGTQAVPQGRLRVAAPASFGRMHLMPGLKEFLISYPELSVDFRFSDSIVDLVDGGFDLAIRNAPLKDSTLVARKLAKDSRIICASPDYLASYGEPSSPSELKDHECLNLLGLETWPFRTRKGTQRIKTQGRLRFDNGEALRIACVDGLGIAISSPWSVSQHLRNGELVELLKNTPLDLDPAIWAIYPSSRQVAPKVRAFIDHYSMRFAKPSWES